MRSVRRLLSLVLATAFAASVTAQVPEGWLVSAAFNSGSGAPAGIFFSHPRIASTAQPMVCVTGVPADLAGANGTFTGANCVLIHDPTGDLLVGELGFVGTSIELHRLTLTGSTVTAASKILLGMGAGGGIVQCAQMVQLDNQTVLVGCSSLSGPVGAPASIQVALVDLVTNSVTPVLLGGLPVGWQLNALTYDPVNDTVYLGLYGYGGSFSQVFKFSVSAPNQASSFGPGLQGIINNLAVDRAGVLWATTVQQVFLGTVSTLTKILPGGTTSYVPSLDLLNGLAVEHSTGSLVVVGGDMGLLGVHLFNPVTGAFTSLGNQLQCGGIPGAISGIAAARSPVPYGQPSGALAMPWSDRPNPQALPVAGQTWTAAVDWPPGTTMVLSGWFATFSSASVPIPPNLTLLIQPPSVASGMMTLDSLNGRSVLSVPLPVGLSGNYYLQSFHLTSSGGVAASNGLHVTIL